MINNHLISLLRRQLPLKGKPKKKAFPLVGKVARSAR